MISVLLDYDTAIADAATTSEPVTSTSLGPTAVPRFLILACISAALLLSSIITWIVPAFESVTKYIKGFNSFTIISTASSTASSSARKSMFELEAF